MKEQKIKVFYTGWFSDELEELDTTKYSLCPDCNGSGENDWEFPVRCFTCFGNGYITKELAKEKELLLMDEIGKKNALEDMKGQR